MPMFTSYDPASGEISRTQGVANIAEAEANAPSGHVTIEGDYSAAAFHFVAGEPTLKADLAVTLAGATVSGLPDPCAIEIIGTPGLQSVAGGVFTLDKPAGRYFLRVTSVAFKDKLLPVTIT